MPELTYHYGKMRGWEVIPGLLIWGTFGLAIILSFLAPLWAIVLIILFDVLWLYRVIYYVIHILARAPFFSTKSRFHSSSYFSSYL